MAVMSGDRCIMGRTEGANVTSSRGVGRRADKQEISRRKAVFGQHNKRRVYYIVIHCCAKSHPELSGFHSHLFIISQFL